MKPLHLHLQPIGRIESLGAKSKAWPWIRDAVGFLILFLAIIFFLICL